MASPLAMLNERLAEAMGKALGPEYADADPVLRRSSVAGRGDYQANAAMPLAKRVGRPPREVAGLVVEHLDTTGLLDAVEVAGPGFVNLTLSDAALGRAAAEQLADPRLGVAPAPSPEVVVVDLSGPNAAKELHVGHLRSTVIGDALCRVLELAGQRVVRQNHVGDWGTQFGMLVEHLVDLGWAGGGGGSISDLDELYREAKAAFDTDPAFAERARRRVVALQAGDPTTLALWERLIAESKRHMEAVYARLGVGLTDADVAPESSYNPLLPDVAAELEEKRLARIDNGALCAFPPGFTTRDGSPLPLIVRKSDGGFGYAATDLAAIRHRARTLRADRIDYVVDARQSQHFAMVFAVAEEAGWLDGTRAEHVAFGSVLGPDGRPFRTRAGETVKLVALLDEAEARAAAVVAEKNPDLPEAERAEVARAVGVGAVKYADLANDRVKDYVFDFDRMLSMEGNTAPYLQYAHARIRSIFRRAEAEGLVGASGEVAVADPAERALVLQLVGLDEVVRQVAETSQPHRLCTYLFELASAFTAFYERCPVLRAPTDAERGSRLALCELTARVLARGLDLLGIEAPERL